MDLFVRNNIIMHGNNTLETNINIIKNISKYLE